MGRKRKKLRCTAIRKEALDARANAGTLREGTLRGSWQRLCVRGAAGVLVCAMRRNRACAIVAR